MESKVDMSSLLDSENIFCTILTNGRLYQGLALLTSLKQVLGEDFFLFIHCVEQESHALLKKLQLRNVYLIHEKKIAKEIRLLKKQRQIHEYCWTLKPVICEYVLTSYPTVKRITYLDSDLYFWSDPQKIFQNQPNCSVLLSIEEKYHPNLNHKSLQRKSRITGLYNSGFISFRHDKIGLQALTWWKEKCLERCKISPEEGLFGDQKYLDLLPSLFPQICDITTSGVNIGLWNYLKYRFSNVNGFIFVDNDLLIFYHFSGVRVVAKDNIESVYRVNRKRLPFIYQIYNQALTDAVVLVEKVDPKFNGFAPQIDLQRYWK
jgi:hypothetical protein